MVKKNNKKESFLKKNYKQVFSYISETRNYIYTILGLFLISFLFGYFFPVLFADNIKEYIKSLLLQTKGLEGVSLIIFIFKNNVLVSFSSILFGLIFGIIPIFTSIANGYVLGFVAGFAVSQEGIFILWRLFPHGIFELPAVIISLGLGLRLGLLVFKKNFKKDFKSYLITTIKVFILLIIPLLIIAAIIEGILVGFVA